MKSTSQPNQNNANPDYGIDAPGLVRFFLTTGTSAGALLIAAILFLEDHALWVFAVQCLLGLATLYLTGMGSLMLVWSKIVKVRERERVFDLIPWQGDEQVLDVGCGRGLMLIGAAQRLTTGRAVGVDIWQAEDQSANTPEATRENSTKAGVAEKIQVETADMRHLPFDDQSFDVVVSHWVVHNLEAEADRSRALDEMVRVLRPRGHLILCDIEYREAYATRLKALGLRGCRVVFHPVLDALLGAVSFGSFRPAMLVAAKPK